LNWYNTATLLIILVSSYLIFLFFSDFDLVVLSIQQVDKQNLIFAIGMWILVVVLTIIRWNFFLTSITKKIPIRSSILYYLAGYTFTITPGGAGEIIRSPFMKKEYGVSISKTATIVFIERFYDLLGVTILISVGLVFSNFEKSIIILPLSLIGFLILIMKNKTLFMKVSEKLSRFKLVKKMMPNAEESFNVISQLLTKRHLFHGILISLGNGFLAVSSVYVLITGMNSSIDFSDLVVIFHASNFIANASMIPGGVGILETSLIGLLTLYEIQYETAISVTILIRFLYTGVFVLAGVICLRIISKRMKSFTNS